MKSLIVLIIFFNFACAIKPTNTQESIRRPNQVAVAENPGVVQIDDPSQFTRVIAVSDVHGMYDQIVTLLRAGKVIDTDNNWIAGPAALVIVGDSIDKGPHTFKVLQLWMQLQQQAPQFGGIVVHTLGNHEAEFITDPENIRTTAFLAELQTLGLKATEIMTPHHPVGQFILNEVVAVRMGRWLFAHSGILPDMRWSEFLAKSKEVLNKPDYKNSFLVGSESILELKSWELDPTKLQTELTRLDEYNLYGIVIGHQPQAFGVIGRCAVKENGRIIKIDNGMGPETGGYPGSLLIFDKPAQMNELSFPEVSVILPDGTQKLLQPE